MSTISDLVSDMTPLQRAVLALKETQAKLELLKRARSEPIAIIGLACRFPGGADSPEAFWRLLEEGGDAITEVPPERWDLDAYYDPDPDAPGKMATRFGGFLGRVDGFDAEFFGITPRETLSMDPQQRLLLETAWEALERAGQPPDRLAGSLTGVFVGISSDDYRDLQSGRGTMEIDPYTGTGAAYSIAAGRLSYLLGLHGPCLPVDTACSSSLVALHLACQSLRAGECDLALAGGVNLILSPERMIYFSKLRAMAPDGRCKTFDARADGYVRGEGCGVVVLKRLSEAQRDGDAIWAVVRGSAVNHDGRSNGLTAPNGAAQQAVLRAALGQANVAPRAVSYVEAHGTGTALGDPIEVQALAAVLGQDRGPEQRLWVGSVKTNFGHLEAAAGMAGLIKTVLALQHQTIPAHLHFNTPSPHIPWAEAPVSIPTESLPWPSDDGPRIAGVSAFGLSGTNAHVVLEEAPPQAADEALAHDRDEPCLLPLSARTPDALWALAGRYAELLAGTDAPALADVAAAAGAGRSHFAQRAAIVSASTPDALAALYALANGQTHPALTTGTVPVGAPAPRVVFVCAGQGGQWPGMVAALRGDPVAAAALEQVAAAAPADLGWSLGDALADPGAAWLERIDQLQPVLFAVQAALAARLTAWGLEPAAVVGHSFGEVAAAYLAGALTLADALRVICARSRTLARIEGQGGMAVVELTPEAVEAALAGYDGAVSVAGVNGPRSVVVSGAAGAVEALVAGWQAQGIFARRLAVGAAAHSGQLDGLVPALEKELGGLVPQAGQVPYYSTVTGQVQGGETLDGGYWARNLREPVMFWGAVQALAGDGHTQFVELGPHPTLTSAVGDGLRALGVDGQALAAMRRDETGGETLLRTVGALYCAGAAVTWPPIGAGRHTAHRLPTYPFQRERYWIDAASPAARDEDGRLPAGTHPLLGAPQPLAPASGTKVWSRRLGRASLPYLKDHQVDGLTVLPGAAYIELLLAAGGVPEAGAMLTGVAFTQMLALPQAGLREMQTVLKQGRGEAAVEVWSRPLDASDAWVRHASGGMRPLEAAAEAPEPLAAIRARCAEEMGAADYYEQLAQQGLSYGQSFRLIAGLWRRAGEALARLEMPAEVAAEQPHYRLHPAVLDACFQLLGAAQTGANDTSLAAAGPILPVGMELLRCKGAIEGELWAHCQLSASEEPGILKADFFLRDGGGRVIVEVRGLRAKWLALDDGRRRHAESDDWLYQVEWQPQTSAQADGDHTGGNGAGPGPWVIFADGGGLGQRVAEMLSEGGAGCGIVVVGSGYARLGRGRYQLDPREPEAYRRVLKDLREDGLAPCRGMVYLWGLDLALPERPIDEPPPGYDSVVSIVQALAKAGWRDAPRLWLATRGAQAIAPGDVPTVVQAPLWGLARTIALEHAELACTAVDLDPAVGMEEAAGQLSRAIRQGGPETQIALRNGQTFAARLVRWREGPPAVAPKATQMAGERHFGLAMHQMGVLDHLRWRAFTPAPPGPGQVTIQVEAAGLNFLDVLSALGARPDRSGGPVQLGAECAGYVVAVGEGVTDLHPGDRVAAIAAPSFGTVVNASARLAVRVPDGLSVEQAAALPIAFVTAYYALRKVARLGAGERVLIHAAAGGTGLAAAAVARWIGAEVWATAGSPEKRQFLRDAGIEHVYDSRSTAFAGEVLAATGGRGVDVVLNSLSGEGLAKGLEALAPHGRFLDISKKDIYQETGISLAPFRRNLSYTAIDLARMVDEQPELVRDVLDEVLRLVAARQLAPLPVTVFLAAEVVDAFRLMAQAQHIGKIVISFGQAAQTPILPAPGEPVNLVRADRTYLITGGLGGLGLKVANWLRTEGARHVALLGRSAPDEQAEQTIAQLESSGVEVVVLQADVTAAEQLRQALERVREALPALGGVVHAAGLLDDGLLLNQTPDRLRRVLAPKLAGAWNLHTLTRDDPLDFFILFSSAAALLGSPGQANYAAANAFLDGLAHHRRAQGRPALSVNWGPFAEVGLVARAERGQQLALRGVRSLTPAQGLGMLRRLLGGGAAQVGVVPINARQWRESNPRAAGLAYFAQLEDGAAPPTGEQSGGQLGTALMAAGGRERLTLLEAHVCEQVGQVMRLPAERVNAATPFQTMGMDSLMALELRNRLEMSLGLTLPATLTWAHPNAAALAAHLAELLQFTAEEAEAPARPAEPARASALERVNELSEDEVDRLLAEKMSRKRQPG